MIKTLLAALAVLTACACAAPQPEAVSGPFATVEFQKGYARDSGNIIDMTDQEYMILDNAGNSFNRAALFSFMNRRETSLTQRVAAGRRLTINAIMTSTEVRFGQCNGRAQFTPVAGRTYTVVQAEISRAVCEFRVVDVTTGAAPEDLEIVNDISGRAR